MACVGLLGVHKITACASIRASMELTPDMFTEEVEAAVKAFDHHVVCLDKSPEDCQASLESLLVKALRAYETRGEGMRHGIALDNQVTIILSQVDEEDRPMCGIYFNLHSPYKKQSVSTEPEPAANQ
jgi:hypothetical protein|tara:strand:- start:7 stop:387 length:381 start_codon:yes stop_codon:yes gene_type:complete